MPKKLFDLSDEDVAALERLRASRGLRSHADAIRQLIRQADKPAEPELIVELRALVGGPPRKVRVAPDEGPRFVPLMERKAFNPQPKKGTKK